MDISYTISATSPRPHSDFYGLFTLRGKRGTLQEALDFAKDLQESGTVVHVRVVLEHVLYDSRTVKEK